jgi:uncharacterized protein DUF4385/uncharacterized protein DUF3253
VLGVRGAAPAVTRKQMAQPTRAAIERSIRSLLAQRAGRTICPSEVARALDPSAFRALMPLVREVAGALRERGELLVTQRGQEIEPARARGPIRFALPSYHGIDFRKHPERYRVGRGEQGVLSAEPYKSELLPLWQFRTPALATKSANAIWKKFTHYRKLHDFVGMDLARKFLQMGFTRARRYASHASGRKYSPSGAVLPRVEDAEKARSAAIFHAAWQRAERDPAYVAWRAEQRRR